VESLALAATFCCVLAVATVTDLERRIVPNRLLAAGALAALAIAAVADPASVTERLGAAAAAAGALGAIALARPRDLGMGDAKLAATMGLYLGWGVAPALLVGFGAGGVVGAALVARHGAAARRRSIPFAPFLALGGVVGLFAGHAIVRWYVTSFVALH
jgi:leader peptidase (prepilin peptidase) / N-methyltransferase